MKQLLRIAIPLGVLVAVVFGVTYFSQYTRKTPDEKVTRSPEVPLSIRDALRQWNPVGSPQDRAFPGFYERRTGDTGLKNTAAFWFENRNRNPVTLQLKKVSCMTCSGARLAPVPPEATRRLLQMSAVQALPQGLVSGLPLGFVGPAAEFDPARGLLTWQSYDFLNHPDATYTVPPADNPDGWSPQWGILELLFSVADLGPKKITAEFDLRSDATKQSMPFTFEIAFEGVDPFGLSIQAISLGEVRETTKEQKFEVLLFSATRGPGANLGDLAEPVTSVDMPQGTVGEVGPFVSVGKPVRVPEDEMDALSVSVSNQLKRLTHLRAAYRFTITFNPQVGDRKIDLGPLERHVSVTVPNSQSTRIIPVTALVRGAVRLDDDRKEIRLADTYKRGTTVAYRLITDAPDAVVEKVGAECSPPFMRVEIEKEKDPPSTDRGYYSLRINVPPESKAGPWLGLVVLELKGKSPQRIRIPVYGKGG